MSTSYFDNFPYIGYNLNANSASELVWVQDIFRRCAPVQNLLKNTQAFYEYVIQEGETPEMIADHQYGSSKYHWVVTMVNNILDPLIDWPKDYANFVKYIVDKYGSVAAASGANHHFTMTITKVDSLGNSSQKTFTIDESKYDTLTSPVPVVTTFSSGVTVTETITRSAQDNYTYELELNESKRHISLLQKNYLPQIVSELERLIA